MPSPSSKNQAALRRASMLLTIPTLLIASPLVGFFLGRFADQRLGTNPWLMFAGVVLGFVAAGREVTLIIRKVNAELEDEKRK